MIGLQHYLTVSAMLFVLSIAGIVVNRKNLILLLMCIELMLLAVNTNFIAFSRYLGDETGQVFVFFILTVAAAEAAIGLAILVVLFRNRRSIAVQDGGPTGQNRMLGRGRIFRVPALVEVASLEVALRPARVEPQGPSTSPLEARLAEVLPDELSPREALELIYQLKALARASED